LTDCLHFFQCSNQTGKYFGMFIDIVTMHFGVV